MLHKGFFFGLLLQAAVGPVAVLIFSIANARGFPAAETGVLAVTLVDGLFVMLAVFGIGAALEKERAKKIIAAAGFAVLAVFGLSMILRAAGFTRLPSLRLGEGADYGAAFVQAFVITAASPLTILFWAGVFASKIADKGYGRGEILIFGAGAVLSTFVCQTAVAIIGSLTGRFLPPAVLRILNGLVGLSLIGFGIKMLVNRRPPKGTAGRNYNL